MHPLHARSVFDRFPCHSCKIPSPFHRNPVHHHAELHKGLRTNLCALLNNLHTHRQLNGVIAVCHALASAFLQSKRAGWALTNLHAFSYSDLAYDCIADLFHRDDEGNYLQWRAYFEGVPLGDLTEEEILAHVRRLVFNKVNHGIFRIFNDLDPSLGKVLRNVKLAIETLNNFVEKDRFGETHIAPSLCETLEHLPTIDNAVLEQVLIEARDNATHVPDILARLSLYLRQQSAHSRLVPMMLVATVIRKLYIPDQQTHAEPGMDGQFTIAETSETIRSACGKVRNAMIRLMLDAKK